MLGSADLVAFIPTTDLDRSHAFYGGLLGLDRVDATPFANAYDAAGTSLRVALVDQPAKAAYSVLGWRAPDISAMLAQLAAVCVPATLYPAMDQDAAGIWTSPSGSRIARFEDPDGNTLSLQEAFG